MKETYLSRRREFKYPLDPVQALEVERFFETIGLANDNYGAERGYYPVTSLYFDSPQYDDYYAKEGGFLRRKKLRARIYHPEFDPSAGSVWLELKKKHDMAIAKERIQLTEDEWRRFVTGDMLYFLGKIRDEGGSEHRAIREFMYFYIRQQYRPSVIVTYDRKPFLEQFTSAVRVTLDKNIHAARVDGFAQTGSMVPVFRNLTVLEVKFKDKMPWWFPWLVKKYDLQRTTFSKYTRSLDAVRGRFRTALMK